MTRSLCPRASKYVRECDNRKDRFQPGGQELRTPPEFYCLRYPDQITERVRRSTSLRDSWHRIAWPRIPRGRATSDSRPPADRLMKRNCSPLELQTSIPLLDPAQ